MLPPVRRELDLALLAARERRLRLVIQILKGKNAEREGAGASVSPALGRSIADFGAQLRDVHRRQAELERLHTRDAERADKPIARPDGTHAVHSAAPTARRTP